MKISDIISWLRFPLSICVVLRHLTTGMGDSVNAINKEFLNILQYSFSSFAVPSFFIISGYLFFYNIESFDKDIYLNKIKKRIKSLLIPYFFWNTFYFFVYYLSYRIEGGHFGVDFSLLGFITGMWACPGVTTPIYFAFWFIRDLIVMCIISPLFYYGINRMGKWFVLSVFVIYIITWNNHSFSVNPAAPICFCLGAYISLKKIKNMPTNKLYQILFLLFTLFLLTTNYLHQYMHVLGSLSMFILGQHLSTRIKIHPFFSNSSFSIFALHVFFLTICYHILLKIFIIDNTFIGIIVILLSFMFTIILCCLSYYLVNKLFPKLSIIIWGGH